MNLYNKQSPNATLGFGPKSITKPTYWLHKIHAIKIGKSIRA